MALVCPPAGIPGAEYYSLVGSECTRAASFFGGKPVLSQGIGYAVVLGFGALFAVVTAFLVRTAHVDTTDAVDCCMIAHCRCR